MKQISLLLFIPIALFLDLQNLQAQDVLRFNNGSELKVKVQEITPQEVKYKRFDNLNGPLITILKNTVQSIRYENGTIESVNEQSNQSPIPTSPNPYVSEDVYSVGDIVRLEYYNVSYDGKVVSVNKGRRTVLVEFDIKGKITKANRRFNELSLVKKADQDALSQQNSVNAQAYVANNSGAQQTPVVMQSDGQNYANSFMQGQIDAKRYYQGYHGAGTGTFLTALFAGPIIGLIPAIACSSSAPKQDRLGFPNNQLAQNVNYYTGYTQEAHRIKSKKVWGNFGIATGILFGLVIVASATAH